MVGCLPWRNPIRCAKVVSGCAIALAIIMSAPSQGGQPTTAATSPCASRSAAVQAPALTVQAPANAEATHLTSLSDAASQYDLPLLIPQTIPEGFVLQDIQYNHTVAPYPQTDFLTVCYSSIDGHYLQVQQGFPLPAVDGPFGTSYAYMPADQRGITTILGKDAYWTRGALVERPDANGSGKPQLLWEPGSLRVAWYTDIPLPDVSPSPNTEAASDTPGIFFAHYTGYELESDVLDLQQLTAIGNSVQPFSP